MNRKIFTILIMSIAFTSKKANAVSFYTGIGVGDSKNKIENYHLDNKKAFTFSIGSSFDIPLFPIRLEAEYLKFNSKKDSIESKIYGAGLNTYVNLPLLPILVPYIGLGISHLTEKIEDTSINITKKSNNKITPQYIIGIDLNLPTVIFAGSLEYRYIDSSFKFDNNKIDVKHYAFLFKARLKF